MRLAPWLAPFALVAFAWGTHNPWIRIHPWTPAFAWTVVALAERWRRAGAGERLFWASLALYLSTFRWKGGDDIPNSLIPFSILRHGTLSLEPFRALFTGAFKSDFTVEGTEVLLSIFPIAPGVLALPVYALPVLAGAPTDWETIHGLAKTSASLLCALSVVVFHRAALRRCSAGWAAGLAVLYALGTYTFSVSSQGLYQHGPGQLGVLLGLLGVWSERPALAGLGFSLAAVARPDTAFFLAAGAVILRRRLPGFALGAAGPLLLLSAYWLAYTGKLAPPERSVQMNLFSSFQPAAAPGMLLSPTRGLAFFAPAAPFGLWGLWRLRRERPPEAWGLMACLAATFALFCFRPSWTAGQTFGNRYFATVSAALALAAAEVEGPVRASPALSRLWAAAFALSILVHAAGAYFNWPGSFGLEAQRAELWSLGLWPPLALFSAKGSLAALPALPRAAAASAFCAAVFAAGWRICAATCLSRSSESRPR